MSTPDDLKRICLPPSRDGPTGTRASHKKEDGVMRLVVIESPYAGKVDRNLRYLRAAMRDCLLRGEAPFASHALYTQPGVLDDQILAERQTGMAAGFAWGRMAATTVVYIDLGISDGMKHGIEAARIEGRPIEYRSLGCGRESG